MTYNSDDYICITKTVAVTLELVYQSNILSSR